MILTQSPQTHQCSECGCTVSREDVRIDAFHSFQDVILPVADFKARYGDRVATLGGVDLDHLTRMDEASLRGYVRNILERCMPGGLELSPDLLVGNGLVTWKYIGQSACIGTTLKIVLTP